MKYACTLTDATAIEMIEALHRTAVSGQHGWGDQIAYLMEDEEVGHFYTEDDSAERQNRPSALYDEVRAIAHRSQITLKKNKWRAGWRFTFEGMRGSMVCHWQVLDLLEEATEVAYESSIKGMLPWEHIANFFARMTGEALHPFEGLDEANRNGFNQEFYKLLMTFQKEGFNTPADLIIIRDTILTEIFAKQAA